MTTTSQRTLAGVLVLCGLAGGATAQGTAGTNGTTDRFGNLPSSIQLTGTVRDFRERSVTSGHPDFERQPTGGFGHYVQQVQDTLDNEGKPVFRSTGVRLTSNWRDAQGRNMMQPREYIASRTGDVAGAVNTGQTGASTNATNFAQWFRDTPGVNASKQLTLNLNRVTGTSRYVFDDRQDPLFQSRGGFFPINGELFGNSANNDRNFHFTFELATEFIYQRGTGQVFTFTGDDDVWVFVDGRLVIDIGGVHGAISQTVDLDRLTWLEDGRMYKLNFFFAERHRTQSNFRVETTLQLRTVEPPQTSGLYD